MFPDQLTLQQNPADNFGEITVHKVDIDNGRSVYRYKNYGITVTLTIAHSVTKENPPFKTDRSVTRIDITRPSTQRPEIETTSSCYLVLATPRGDGATNADTKQAFTMLTRFLLGVASDPTGDLQAALQAGGVSVDRLLTGEV